MWVFMTLRWPLRNESYSKLLRKFFRIDKQAPSVSPGLKALRILHIVLHCGRTKSIAQGQTKEKATEKVKA